MVELARPPAHPRRLVYLGTPAMAVPPLRSLHQAGYEIVLVVSRPDARRGRRAEPTPSPVKAAALELGLPVTDDVDAALEIEADLGVVVAYGRLLRTPLLEALPLVNLHFSLLPRWRGAAPVERAVLAGDHRTGVDLMVVAPELDTGDVYAEAVVDIGPEETAEELRARLVTVGTRLLLDTLAAGLPEPRPQTGEATYAAKIDRDDLRLDFGRSAVENHRVVRVGGAWTTFRGAVCKVWRGRPVDGPGDLAPGQLGGDAHTVLVGCADGALELLEVQPAGRGRMPADAWRNGARPSPDERLGHGPAS